MVINITQYVLIFILTTIGICETIYLIRKRKAAERPMCVMGGGCHEVLESKYNHTFGLPNDVMGLLFYVVLAVLSILINFAFHLPLMILLAKITIIGGVLMSFYLIYLQARVIKTWCFWCLMSAATIFLLAGVIFAF